MNLLSLYHFFAGKASDKQKEAIKRWAESSPDNYETLCREKKIFDAAEKMIQKNHLDLKNSIVLYNENWHNGVIGIVASRLRLFFWLLCLLLFISIRNW